MRAVLATAALAIAAGPAFGQSLNVPSGTYRLDPAHTDVLWKVDHFGLSPYVGRFDRSAIDATIELDAEDVTNSTLTVTIRADGVVTNDPGAKDFDAEIEGDMFFAAAAHPEITFVSTDIEVSGEDTATITGDLTFKGVTLPVELDVVLNGALEAHPMAGAPALGISASAVIDRTDFGVTSLAGPIGTEVDVEIHAEFLKAE